MNKRAFTYLCTDLWLEIFKLLHWKDVTRTAASGKKWRGSNVLHLFICLLLCTELLITSGRHRVLNVHRMRHMTTKKFIQIVFHNNDVFLSRWAFVKHFARFFLWIKVYVENVKLHGNSLLHLPFHRYSNVFEIHLEYNYVYPVAEDAQMETFANFQRCKYISIEGSDSTQWLPWFAMTSIEHLTFNDIPMRFPAQKCLDLHSVDLNLLTRQTTLSVCWGAVMTLTLAPYHRHVDLHIYVPTKYTREQDESVMSHQGIYHFTSRKITVHCHIPRKLVHIYQNMFRASFVDTTKAMEIGQLRIYSVFDYHLPDIAWVQVAECLTWKSLLPLSRVNPQIRGLSVQHTSE